MMTKDNDKKNYIEKYQRLGLKNGYDLPEGETPPLTGKKQEMRRAYELLVLKDDFDVSPERKSERGKQQAPQSASSVMEVLDVMTKEELKARKGKRRMIAAGLILSFAIVITGRLLFGPAILTADISSYEEVKIEVTGLEDKPIYITAGELADMRKKSIKVDVHQGEVPEGQLPEEGKAIGPTLETFLGKYGKKTEDFRAMRVYQENGSSKAYVRTMKEKEIILSVANGGDPLGEKQAPLRIAVRDEDAGEWFGWVRKIEFK